MELYPHNQVVFNKVFMMLVANKRCALVQGTGTGKSFILMKLLETLFVDMDVLMAVPEASIIESIQLYDDWNFDNVRFITYDGLKKVQDFSGVLVIDELHRAGAVGWNKEIRRLAAQAEYFLGMTATKQRYLDGNRDMAKELFGECVVHGPSYDEAIQMGILAGYDYYAILSDVEEYVDKLNKATLPSELKVRVSGLKLNEYQLSQRVRSHIDYEHRKWVAFYPTVTALMSAEEELREWFSGHDLHVYIVHSKQSNQQNKQSIRDFNSDNGYCVIASVNMLNEGVHLKGVTGVMLMRKTSSGNIFTQQLGRGSSTNTSVRIRYLDLVKNFDNVRIMCERVSGARMRSRSVSGSESQVVEANQVLVCYDELLLELEDIMATVEGRWSGFDDDIIKAYYPVEGADCWLRIPHRTRIQVTRRARVLGVTKTRRWTDTEDLMLKLYYKSEGDEIWKRLPSRSMSAIHARLRKLGLTVSWTPEEELVLIRRYDSSSMEALKLMLPGKDEEMILEKATRLGL